jgi:transcriptional regulator with XRE-family HTH domain
MATTSGFAAKLRALRDAARMSQQDLADAAGLSRPYLARLELARQEPGWETVLKLAEALDVPTDAFRDVEEEEAPTTRKAKPAKQARKKK